tara:strand:+ start:79 stop:1329 length:1251 start_codon:yes stop_codon:yes gene_type:complete
MAKRIKSGIGRNNLNLSRRNGSSRSLAVRVTSIILDSQHPSFNKFGQWNSIGRIFFTRITSPNQAPDPTENETAKPLFPNTKHYPLINEIVYIMSLPDSSNAESPNATSFYYFNPINVWNSSHHNGIPEPFESTLPESQQRDYEEVTSGSIRRVNDGGTEINLGSTFTENSSSKTLLPYEGDIIQEGRFGQSLRYGSTVPSSFLVSPWSTPTISGSNGDPITLIRNGQHEDDSPAWVPQVEDINKDKSSIYLTSTQRIPIEVSDSGYIGYYTPTPSLTPPTSPDIFGGEQIILNSGRLLFNAKTDSILLTSADSIKINSLNSVVIETPVTVVQSRKIYLGNKASESLILGDKFLDRFKELLLKIIDLSKALESPIGSGKLETPNGEIAPPAVKLKKLATIIKDEIEDFKSKVTKTK